MEGLAVMGFVLWNGRCNSISSTGKINKNFKGKRNSGRELQRRVMHCSKQSGRWSSLNLII